MMRVDGRRLARAAGLTLVLVALLGGGTGLALAQVQGSAPAAMARPQPGAHAEYTATEFHVGPANGALHGLHVDATWMPERWVPDGDLDLRLVHPLVMRLRLGDAVYEREADYDAATGAPVLSSGHGEYGGSYYQFGEVLGATEPADHYRYDEFNGRGGLCGARTALQDGQDVRKPLLVTGYCDYLDGSENLTYEYLGHARQGGRTASHFQVPGRPEFQLWVAPDTPFPVRVTTTLSNAMCTCWIGHERMYDLVLVDSTPGNGSYTWPAAPLVSAGPGLPRMVPLAPHVVDTAGFPSPFPFDAAYAAAASPDALCGDEGELATRSCSLGPWLQAHPMAYVAEAYWGTWRDPNGAQDNAWYFIVTDGHEWTGRAVVDGGRFVGFELCDAWKCWRTYRAPFAWVNP
jgi:hypothetical protein